MKLDIKHVYDVYGPFELHYHGTGKNKLMHDEDVLAGFVKQISKHKLSSKDLSQACGCYVFALTATSGDLPWYVGKTSKKTFSDESTYVRNIHAINKQLHGSQRKPVLYLLPLLTDKGDKFAKPTTSNSSPTAKTIDHLETWLIGMAFRRNPEILNKQKITRLRQLEIRGIMNTERRRGKSQKEMRKVFGWE